MRRVSGGVFDLVDGIAIDGHVVKDAVRWWRWREEWREDAEIEMEEGGV